MTEYELCELLKILISDSHDIYVRLRTKKVNDNHNNDLEINIIIITIITVIIINGY